MNGRPQATVATRPYMAEDLAALVAVFTASVRNSRPRTTHRSNSTLGHHDRLGSHVGMSASNLLRPW